MKLPRLLTPFFSFFACVVPLSAASHPPLGIGDAAPSVVALADDGNEFEFSHAYAKSPYTLVYFYPKADTPGCTAQGCSLRDAYEELSDRGLAVIGVSTDTVEAQRAFKEAQGYPFTLIADTEKKVMSAFGVPSRTFNGNAYAARQAYLIYDGKIVWVDYKASTDEQAADVLKVLAGLKS